MIKYIFCDLDGTLYHNGISEEDATAINDIEKSGIKFNIATGRVFTQAVKMTQDDISMNGYYICENGSYIYDCNKNLVFKGTIDDNIVKKVIALYESDKATMYFKYNGKVVLLEDNDCFKIYSNEYLVDKEFATKNTYNGLVGNIGIVSKDVDELYRLESFLIEEFNDVLDIYFSSEYTLNLVPKGVSKHEAIINVCKVLEVSLDEIATIGDSPNDISMLETTKYSFAMKNSRKEVIESANYTADAVDDAIRKIKEINKNLKG
ncbi:Cof-type HAD-IIB family hydrolase [Paraclostridium ghonii]|uniref:Cof subfamily protein (Haloacid dehalogenase superfamily) n=1 Tax=Paraclostridium ghonii TaxID=29358 RepID=A0ABU0MYX7_9FIRM|nr:HAD family hydrolase [Paeniclostridium ghonii]MDQ0556117.1 Cof subfamily protein (haloacid dehalogenase superfamily) [Paeniclostridium ghonii]